MGKDLKGKELGKGISQRKDGRYQARYTNRFGQRKTIYGKTLNDVVKKLREEKYLDENKLNSINGNMTLDEWYKQWLNTFKLNTCRDTTIQQYKSMYRTWIFSKIGNMKMKDISQIHLQEVVNSPQCKGTRNIVRALIVNMFKYAVSSEIIAKNVAYNLDTRHSDDEEQESIFLTDDEIDIIMKYSEGTFVNYFYRLVLQTGMRSGEVLGLTWDNVDFEKNVIHVVQQVVTVKSEEAGKQITELHKPKSRAGIRDIPMTKETRQIFIEMQNRDNITIFPRKGDFVFSTKNNTPQYRTAISNMSDNIRKRILKDYPDFKRFSPHSFRHTFASKMIMSGVKPKVLQIILGHSQLQTTMNIYCHVYDDQLQEAMSLFENGAKVVSN